MIKNQLKWVLALAMTLVFQLKSFAGDKVCHVSGAINGVQKDVKVMILRRVGEFGIDTVQVAKTMEGGAFSIVLAPSVSNELLDIRFEGLRFVITFVAEKGNVVITGDKTQLYAADIKGTPENVRWNAYQKYTLGLTKKRNELMQSKSTISREEYVKKFNELDAMQKQYADSLIAHCPKSIVALYLAKAPLPMMKYSQIDSTLKHFKPYFSTHKYYLEMKERADVLRKVTTGVMAPDFTVLQSDGKSKISLSSFRGKYVMLDFWASWCVPCRAENVQVKELYNKYHPYGLEIISFSLDSDLKAWQKAIEKDGLTWNNASDLVGGKLSPVATAYGIDGLPAVWIIDPSGKVIAESLKGEKLDQFLASLFIH